MSNVFFTPKDYPFTKGNESFTPKLDNTLYMISILKNLSESGKNFHKNLPNCPSIDVWPTLKSDDSNRFLKTGPLEQTSKIDKMSVPNYTNTTV